MSVPSPIPTDGYIDLLQIDLGTIDGDSNVYVGQRNMRRAERAAFASLQRQEIVRMERTATAQMRRVDE